MKKLLSIVLAASLVLAIMTGCGKGSGSSQQTQQTQQSAAKSDGGVKYAIKAATSNSPPHPYILGLQKLSELLNQKSNGQIKLDVFHSGQLGSERDIVEGMQLNTIQFACITSAPLSGFTDAYNIFDLPFLFESVEQARKFCDSDYGLNILASLEAKGVIGLGFGENGMRHITNSKRPIVKPADLKDIKIRTMENPIHMEAFRVMGADPTPMAFGELFTALQQKAIDAEENPLVVIDSSKFYEVQQYLSVTEHLYSPAPFLVSKTFFDSLPADLQQLVRQAGIEAKDHQRSVCDEQSARLQSELEKKGMKINIVDKAPFVAATKPVYDKYIGNLVSQESYDAIKKFLNK